MTIKRKILDHFFANDKSNLSIDTYLLILGIFMALVLVFAPQIYIKNSIYYKSRSINQLYIKYQTLKEENKQLQRELETLYFNQVFKLDTQSKN